MPTYSGRDCTRRTRRALHTSNRVSGSAKLVLVLWLGMEQLTANREKIAQEPDSLLKHYAKSLAQS